MSELEDPVDTVIRLIKSLIRVVKDNGDVASLTITECNYDREVLKEYDGQVTVSMANGLDEMIKDGSLRREVNMLKCSVFSVDKSAPGSDPGRVMRKKIAEQVKTIIREKRTIPYQTVYNYYGLGYPSGDPHKAFAADGIADLVPSSTSWVELTNLEYQSIWSSDDVRFSKSRNVSGKCALMLFRFKIEPRETCVKKIVVSFEGYGISPNGNGVKIKVWNHVAGAWEHQEWNLASTDAVIYVTLTSAITDYIDQNGYFYALVETRTTSDGVDPAILYCDFVQAIVEVSGITHVDLGNFRNVLVTDLKPYLHSAEITVKAWRFVTVS